MSTETVNHMPWRAEQSVKGRTWDVVRGRGNQREQATTFCPLLDRPAFASYGRQIDAEAFAQELNGGER